MLRAKNNNSFRKSHGDVVAHSFSHVRALKPYLTFVKITTALQTRCNVDFETLPPNLVSEGLCCLSAWDVKR